MLDKQVKIFALDTNDFYYNSELRLHVLNHKLKVEKNNIITKMNGIISGLRRDMDSETVNMIRDSKEKDISSFNFLLYFSEDIRNKCSYYLKLKNVYLPMKKEKIKSSKERLKNKLADKVRINIATNGKDHIRAVRGNSVRDKEGNLKLDKIIAVFESYFTRTAGCITDELTDNFMEVQVYYFDVAKDISYYGFMYNGEKYIYFSSSAGQIRTKKMVFVKENLWNNIKDSIMCGLTYKQINNKGGCNPNKLLAYTSLSCSATDEWKEFDIDKTIVVDDFETEVYGWFDRINTITYEIKREYSHTKIPHCDGAGMMLPNAFGVKQCNKMIRIPWFKGLLGVFDFQRFIKDNNCSPVVKDIYGKEHDVIKEDIQVIFTASQFKMWKYYRSYDEYKENYHKYNCKASFTNPEEEYIKDSKINYQMLQTITDFTDDELYTIVKHSINKAENMCDSISSCKNILGVKDNSMSWYQKCIDLYPDLMNDKYSKVKLRQAKEAVVKRYKAGKIDVEGKYTFVLPDLYAFSEWLFKHESLPKGLLQDGEVYCKLFSSEEVDVLRSPHLYREHCVRKNMYCIQDNLSELRDIYFDTKAIYTSTYDLISKVLAFDVDGDHLMVIGNKDFVNLAKKNVKNVVPLIYDMKKAEPSIINNQVIWKGLNAAFTGSNIGMYSNAISKIWNSGVFTNGSEEDKENAAKAVKWLVCENNHRIDYAKTLYMIKRPKYADDIIRQYTQSKLPHFFIYAKNKKVNQVEKCNNSFVNKLEYMIPNKRLNFRHIGLRKPDLNILMHNPNMEVEIRYKPNGQIDYENSNSVVNMYHSMARVYSTDIIKATNLRNKYYDEHWLYQRHIDPTHMFYDDIAERIRNKFLVTGYTNEEIADILIRYLYDIKDTPRKDLFWLCYGEFVYHNIIWNTQKIKWVKCIDCGDWFVVNNKDNAKIHRCHSCYSIYRKQYVAKKVREHRQNVNKAK